MTKQMRIALLAATAAMILPSGGAMVFSDRTFVFLRPETSSFWRTATNDVVTVPIDLPRGASSATLSVSGVKYSQVYEGLAGGSYDLHLPSADSPETENVYDLVLSFDNGEERTAKIGLVQGLSPDAEGTTRCLAPSGSRKWCIVKKRAVLPIPYGTTSLSVEIGGETTTATLDGSQGWFALEAPGKGAFLLSWQDEYGNDSVPLIGIDGGTICVVK